MHKLAGLCVLLLLVLPAAAQEAPKAELFGGYSYASFEGGNGVDRLNLNGWNTSVAGNFNRWFGVVGDFSGQYGSQAGVDRNTHSFLFGPRFFSRNNERMTPFVHALFGIARAHREGGSGEPARTENAFSTAIGGGLDVKAGEAVAIRLVRYRMHPKQHPSVPEHAHRYAAQLPLLHWGGVSFRRAVVV
jgi:hypothetical protein